MKAARRNETCMLDAVPVKTVGIEVAAGSLQNLISERKRRDERRLT